MADSVYFNGARYTWNVQYFDKRKVFEAWRAYTGNAGDADMASPQDWYNANFEEIQCKHGVVWFYPSEPGNILGGPLFVTDMLRDMGIEFSVEWEDK